LLLLVAARILKNPTLNRLSISAYIKLENTIKT
jgi:hypothetical protein